MITDLGVLPGDCFSQAFAINSRGQVVGQSLSCVSNSAHSFLWEKGSMIDLDTFVPPNSGLQLVETLAINDRGEITGDLVPPSCTGPQGQGNDVLCGHAYELVQVSEDDMSATAAASQNNSGPVSQSTTTVTLDGPAAKETMARIRAQLARRNHIPGLSAWANALVPLNRQHTSNSWSPADSTLVITGRR